MLDLDAPPRILAHQLKLNALSTLVNGRRKILAYKWPGPRQLHAKGISQPQGSPAAIHARPSKNRK